MRTLTLAALVFLSFAPVAFAADPCPAGGTQGVSCVANGVSGTCQYYAADTPGVCESQSAGGTTQSVTTLINPLKSGASLSSFLTSILQFVVTIGTVVIILMVVYIGYLFVVAQGVPAKINEAKQALLWTVVGALILLGAQAIATAIQATVTAVGG